MTQPINEILEEELRYARENVIKADKEVDDLKRALNFQEPELATLRAQLSSMREQNAQMREALRDEWEYNERLGDYFCPVCHYSKSIGHRSECKLAAVLSVGKPREDGEL